MNIIKNSLSAVSFLFIISILLLSACLKDNSNSEKGNVYTTVDRTIVPDPVPVFPAVAIDNPADFGKYGYGNWHYGPGIPVQKRLDLMPAGYDFSVSGKGDKLIRFFAMTDIHLTDKESPAQAIFFRKFAGNNAVSCYSPLMLYTTHVLDAAVRTINSLNRNDKFDFGISLGDMANSTQYNEIRWFIDILDGKVINPDSGEQDDPVPGPGNDYQDEFQAEGLDSSIPWYAAIGNHDHFWMGSKPVNDKIREVLTGTSILTAGNIFTDPYALDKDTYLLGTLNGSTLYGQITGEGVVADMGVISEITADNNRKSLTREEIMKEFSISTSLPAGHGFIQEKPDNYFRSCYSFEPKAGLPLKVIVLDDTQDETDTEDGIFGHGSLENGRHDWLMNQLKKGQEDGKLMIIAAHVPIGVAPGQEVGWYDNTVESNLITELKSYPNLILWIAGHRHLNNITPFPSSDAGRPENGFWEVETKSLREFPQQFRTFDIVFNADRTISIKAVDVDPDVKEGSFAEKSRSYSIASGQIYKIFDQPLQTGSVSYNAELIKVLTSGMQSKLAEYVKNYNNKTKI